ncbi:MAG: outer membrane beta-barrel protein [Chthoniobacteraceae bacterium]
MQGDFGAAPTTRAVATPGDSDLGKQIILPLIERSHPWSLFASAADYYTDNVTLAKVNKQGDGYFFGEAGARYDGKLTESLSLEATIREGFFRYHGLSAQDFNSLNAGTGLYYNWKELWGITVFGRYNFEWLTDASAGRDLLANHTLSVGAQKTFALEGGNSIYVGYTSIFGFAQQSAAERNEHVLYAGGQAHLTKSLDADLYARLALFDYRQGTRRDMNGTAVAALTYHFNRSLSVNVSYSFVFDRSNQSRFDYDADTTGGGFAFRYDF